MPAFESPTRRPWASGTMHLLYRALRFFRRVRTLFRRPIPHIHFVDFGQRIYPGDVFPATVIRLENGRIWGKSGAMLTESGQLLDEFSIEIGRPHDHSIEYQWRIPPAVRTSKLTTVLAASKGGNYFHWMTDVLPRIHLLQQAGVRLDDIELFVVNKIEHPFQLETLASFGIPRAKLVEAHPRLHLQPASMVVASLPGIPGDTPQWAVNFLRDHFQPQPGPPRRIYISRTGTRRIRNEEELLAHLPGFERVFPERLTVREQADLFASAECVVAPHGAGLTNLIFCRPATRVVEIFSPNYVNYCCRNLARHNGLDYTELIGAGKRRATDLVRDDITLQEFDALEGDRLCHGLDVPPDRSGRG
jgi:capsular polysaccharide biosynthesis protein